MPSKIRPVLDEHTTTRLARLFRAFSDTSRVRILHLLIRQESNVSDVAEMVGISKSAISHQLRGLRQLRLVEVRRNGKEVYYRVQDEHVIDLICQGVNHVQGE